MQHVLPVVLVREVDIIEEEGEVHQEPLGKVEVDGGALEEAHMEHRLANTAPGQKSILAWSPDILSHVSPVLDIPAVLGVQVWVGLGAVALHQSGQQLTPLVLEGGGVGELPDEGELLGGGPDGVADAGDLGAVDPLSCTQVIW